MVGPARVVQLHDGSVSMPCKRISQTVSEPKKVLGQLFFTHGSNFHFGDSELSLECFVVCVHRPELLALDSRALLEPARGDYELSIFLGNHAPKISDGILQGPLCCNYPFVSKLKRTLQRYNNKGMFANLHRQNRH